MDLIKKINWRWLMMIVAVVMMGVATTACSDDDDDDEDGSNGVHLGVWAYAEEIENGENEVFAVKLTGDGMGQDGRWNMEEEKFRGESGKWRYSIGDGTIIIYDDESGDGHSVPFTISEDGRVGTFDGEKYIKVQ